eukprot:s3111_g1.t1
MTEPRKWEAMGWRELQHIAQERWCVPPVATCKRTSRKDFVFVSPALQKFIKSVANSWEHFADHSILSATMAFPKVDLHRACWPKPQAIQYVDPEEVAAIQAQEVSMPSCSNATQAYETIFSQFEQTVHAVKRELGHSGLSQQQRGRGRTKQRTFQKSQIAPLNPSRQGELVPSFDGLNLQYKRWFTQHRRLTAYRHLANLNRQEPTALEHKYKLWKSILLAPGFTKSFALWWPTRATKKAGDIALIPSFPPGFQTAQYCVDQFLVELQHLENILKSKRHELQVGRYQADANTIFRDVRRQSPEPVQVLVAKEHAVVNTVHDACSVEVSFAGTAKDQKTWQSKQGCHVVAQQTDSCITFDAPHALVEGDVLTHDHLVGSVAEIHEEFAREWTARWDRHLNLPPDHFAEIVKFAELAFPSRPMQYQPIDLATWKQTIASKRTRTATGPDGISKQDLIALPDSLHLEVIRLLHRAEEVGEWPSQALQGAIHSLAKCPQAESVDQFRPVTILPLIYRCWGTIRSKQLLAHIESIAPATMYGNLPGRSSPAVWWQIQSLIEGSLYDDAACSGIMTDLVKAFNGLPRCPLFEVAIHIGVCPQVVRGWAAAVSGVTRQFWVRGQPGPPLRSSTGFPEGCGMSVVAMCLCNLVLHSYMTCRCPQVSMSSYVDNVELMSSDPNATVEALDVLSKITEFLGTPVDPKKTYGWALNTAGRNIIRNAQHAVNLSHADLGAHLQYSGNQTNGAVKKKCQALSQLWPRLAQSNAPLTHKLRVLVSVAWPRAFHAASTVHIGDAVIQDLRSGAMQGLRLDKTGASSFLQLSLTTNTLLDPGFFVLWDALLQFRRYANDTTDARLLDLAAWTPDRRKKPGPCGVLCARLSDVGWTHLSGFVFADQDGLQVDIMSCPLQELKQRSKRAWHHHVGATMEFRKGFQGLAYVDVPTSTRPVPSWTPDEAGLIRALQNGTFMTHDHLYSAKQTILRAELTAVIMAVQQSIWQNREARIWCDNATVVRRMRRMLNHSFVNRNTLPDHDLWGTLQALLHSCVQPVTIYKVNSHQVDHGHDDFLTWVFQGNQAADFHALLAMQMLPSQLLTVQAAAATDLANNRRLQQELHAFYAKVGLFAVQWKDVENAQVTESRGTEPITAEVELSLAQVGRHAHAAPQQMQFREFYKVLEWLDYVQSPDPSTPASWVTWYELLWSFQRHSGIRELRKVDCHSRWEVKSEREEYDCIKACRSFSAFMTHLIRVMQPGFQSKVVKPTNYRWQMWGCCIAFRWRPQDKEMIYNWIHSEAGSRQFCKVQQDLGSIRPATLAEPAAVPLQLQGGLHRWSFIESAAMYCANYSYLMHSLQAYKVYMNVFECSGAVEDENPVAACIRSFKTRVRRILNSAGSTTARTEPKAVRVRGAGAMGTSSSIEEGEDLPPMMYAEPPKHLFVSSSRERQAEPHTRWKPEREAEEKDRKEERKKKKKKKKEKKKKKKEKKKKKKEKKKKEEEEEE